MLDNDPPIITTALAVRTTHFPEDPEVTLAFKLFSIVWQVFFGTIVDPLLGTTVAERRTLLLPDINSKFTYCQMLNHMARSTGGFIQSIPQRFRDLRAMWEYTDNLPFVCRYIKYAVQFITHPIQTITGTLPPKTTLYSHSADVMVKSSPTVAYHNQRITNDNCLNRLMTSPSTSVNHSIEEKLLADMLQEPTALIQ